MGLAEEITARSAASLDLVMGTVSGVDTTSGIVTVNVGGVDIDGVLFANQGYSPYVGDGVSLLRQGNRLVALGANSVPLSPIGVVTTVPGGSPTIIVTVSGHQYSLPFINSYSPTVADRVYISWPGTSRAGVVLGKIGVTTPAPEPPPPPPPPTTPTFGTTTFAATGAGTWRSGWRTDANDNVIQGTAPGFPGANEGAWFYSGLIANSLAGATVTGMQIYLGRTSGGVFAAQTCHLYRVGDDTQPGGALSFGSGPYDVDLAVGQEGWFGVSTVLGQQLVDSGGSVGITGTPYMRMFGLSQSGSAGALSISWRR